MIDDALLRKIVEDAIRSGNRTLETDLAPQLGIKRRPMPWDQPDRGPDAMLRENPQSAPAPQAMPQGFLGGLRDRLFSGGPLPYNADLRRGDRNYASRNALRMFVQGLNANPRMAGEHGELGIRGAMSGRGGRAPDPNNDLRRALLQAQIEATGALKGSRDARTSEINQPDDVLDPLLDEKEAWWASRTDANKALAENRRRPPSLKSAGGGKGKSAGSNRAQLSARFQAKVKEMTARVAAIGATNGWSPEEIKAAQARQVARLADEYSALLTGDGIVQETPAWQDAGRPPAQRYTKPTKTGVAASGGKASDNPNLTPEQRAFYKKQGL